MSAIGFIGLGQIGSPMAGHLIGWPGGLVVCDVLPNATAALEGRGARVEPTPAGVAQRVDLISIMVRDDDQVRQVVGDILPAASRGTVVAIHSTIAPATGEALAAEADPHGVAVVDAPVSGGFVGAAQGSLAVFVGGPADAVERCRASFERWSTLFVHTGPVGSATRAKLARNLLQFAAFAAALEAQRLAEAAGIDLVEFAKVVKHSDRVTGGPGAIMLRDTTEPLGEDGPLRAILTHTRELGEKDLRLALELGADLGIDLPFAALALQRFGPALGLP